MKDAYFASDNVTVSIRDENALSASNRFKQPHILSSTMPKDASPQGEEHLTKDVAETLITLRRGGTILYPTDTIWGIGCDAANATAIASIYRIKRRAVSKSLIVLVSDLTMLARYVGVNACTAAEEYARAERPTTVIYPSAKGLAEGVASSDGSVGIRIARHPFCEALIRELDGAIVSTSANISGHAPQGAGLESVEEEIRNSVDYIVNEREDTAKGLNPSRIVRLLAGGSVEILRE